MIGYSSTFMDKIIERADKRQERMEKMIGKMLDKSEKILQAGMTNKEWLQTATTEQLAEWLQEHMDCAGCGCNKDLCYKGYDCCKLAFVDWLKEVHR